MQTPTRELPFLGGLSAFFRWIEDGVNIASGPILTIGLGISLVDLLTDGALLVNLPVLLYAWAVSQAIGVEAQLVASFDRARQSLREGRPWSLLGLLALGALLAYVSGISAYAFALQQADHYTVAQALASIGMDPTVWLVQRAALSVGLVCLSGWTRYHPPAKVRLSVEDELAEIDRKVKIEAANQRLRETQAVGAAHLGRRFLAAAKGKQLQDDTQPETPPTGPGTPLVSAPLASYDDESDGDTGVLSLPTADEWTEQPLAPAARGDVPSNPRAVRKTISAKVRKSIAWDLLNADPDLSAEALRLALQKKGIGCRWELADRYAREYRREHLPQRRVQ